MVFSHKKVKAILEGYFLYLRRPALPKCLPSEKEAVLHLV